MGINAIIDDIFHGNRNWDAIGLINIIDILLNVIKLLLLVAGSYATIYIVVSGYHYFTAFGNEQQATKGKNGLTYAIIGVVIIVMSFAIIQFVMGELMPANKIPEDIKYFNK